MYPVTITASDCYKNWSQTFIVNVQKRPPQFIIPGNQEFILGDNFDWTLPSNTFFDEEGDPLTYAITLINQTTKEEEFAPDWVNLDITRLRVYGEPEASDIIFDMSHQGFFQIFMLRLNATNIAQQTCSFYFNLSVQNI